MDDVTKLRARSDALAAEERETHQKLCELRAELDAITGQLDALSVTAAPRMFAADALNLFSLGRRKMRMH